MRKLLVITMSLISVFFKGEYDKNMQFVETESKNVSQVVQQQSEVSQGIKETVLQHLNELMMSSREDNIYVKESPNGAYVCGIDYETNHIVILDAKNTVVLDKKLVSPVDKDLDLTFYAWGEEKEWLWLVHNRTYQIKDFVKIDLTNGNPTYFKQTYGFATDFALQPDTGYLCFSNAPIILDIYERKTFVESNQEVTLKLVNLLGDGKVQIIETANGRAFEPKWIGPYEFTYNNPYLGRDEIEKVTYVFNQPFELLPKFTEPINYETPELFKKKYDYILKQLKKVGANTNELISLYGYKIPIKNITLWGEKDELINEKGYIHCSENRRVLFLYINDRQAKECTLLANFFGLKYKETTVKWLMEKFINERDSYIAFTDGSYIQFSMTTGGFKSVYIGMR